MNGAPTVDTAFINLIPQGATLLADARPAMEFAQLRFQEPTPPPIPPLECDLELLPTVKTTATLTAKMRPVYEQLLHELRRFEPTKILFTAFDTGQGTTFTAENLATLWAEQVETETILFVEFYSGVHDAQDYNDEYGEVFREAQVLESFLYYDAARKIYRLNVAAGAAELSGLPAVMRRLTATFTRIFADVTPAGYNPLFAPLVASMNGVVLVARHSPDAGVVKKFVDDLRELGGRFMGVVLNANG